VFSVSSLSSSGIPDGWSSDRERPTAECCSVIVRYVQLTKTIAEVIELWWHSTLTFRAIGDRVTQVWLNNSNTQPGIELLILSEPDLLLAGLLFRKNVGPIIWIPSWLPSPATHSSHHRHFVEDPCCNAHCYCSSSCLTVWSHTKSCPLFPNHYFNISGLLPCCRLSIQTTTFNSLHIRTSGRLYFERMRVKFVYEGHRVKLNVSIPVPACKTSIAHSSGSIKDRVARFACSMRFGNTVDRMVWPPSLSRDRPEVTTRK